MSVDRSIDFSLVKNVSIINHKLNFSQIFGAWLVFDKPVDWDKCTIRIFYDFEV
jgi:hypothetical protein